MSEFKTREEWMKANDLRDYTSEEISRCLTTWPRQILIDRDTAGLGSDEGDSAVVAKVYVEYDAMETREIDLLRHIEKLILENQAKDREIKELP